MLFEWEIIWLFGVEVARGELGLHEIRKVCVRELLGVGGVI